MTIRDAAPSDAQGLFRLNELFNGTGTNDAESMRRALIENAGELISVAENADGLVGFICGRVFFSACYPDRSAEITELFVEEAHRRAGIASALIKHMQARFYAAGAADFHLLTGRDNSAARAFYEKMGYLPCEEIMYRFCPQE